MFKFIGLLMVVLSVACGGVEEFSEDKVSLCERSTCPQTESFEILRESCTPVLTSTTTPKTKADREAYEWAYGVCVKECTESCL